MEYILFDYSTNGSSKAGEEGTLSRPTSPHTYTLSPGESSMEIFNSSIRELNGTGNGNELRQNIQGKHISTLTSEQSRYFQDLSTTIPLSVASAFAFGNKRTTAEEPHLQTSG